MLQNLQIYMYFFAKSSWLILARRADKLWYFGSSRTEQSHFTLKLLKPKLMNESGRDTEKPARAEPKLAGSWLDPPLATTLG